MEKSQTRNLVLQTDSYKFTHWKQYPPGTQFVYSYLESRGGMFEQTLFFGLQYYLLEFLAGSVVTEQEVVEARDFVDRHIGPGVFNFKGWMHIVRDLGGRLPVVIKAVAEGAVRGHPKDMVAPGPESHQPAHHYRPATATVLLPRWGGQKFPVC